MRPTFGGVFGDAANGGHTGSPRGRTQQGIQSLRVLQGGAAQPSVVRPAVEPAPVAGVAPTGRLARVIYMASVGGYMAVHHERLVEVNGRMIWPSAESLAADAPSVGIVASTLVINTARS